MSQSHASYLEHAEDVLRCWLDWSVEGGAALVIVTRTAGGGVRSPGTLMAVSPSGAKAGYVSGGCIDADVVLQATCALRSGSAVTLVYGAGSRFRDLPLPCGGSIELLIVPRADPAVIAACQRNLADRKPATLCLDHAGTLLEEASTTTDCLKFRYIPKLRLRIAGRGAECLALARLAMASGIETTLQVRDGDDVDEAYSFGFSNVQALTTPSSLPPISDDSWTAFLLAFHDTEWEAELLAQALSGRAFYVGAVGSKRTHARRCEKLRENGVAGSSIARIRGPVGLVHSTRDASTLAISALAEITQVFHDGARKLFDNTAIILLAAGQSSRFERGDKLLAAFSGQPLLVQAARLLHGEQVAARIAIVAPDQDGRAEILRAYGWKVVVNEQASMGIGSSIAVGVGEAANCPNADAALILLGDMPSVTDDHLMRLRRALSPELSAVLSMAGRTLVPPGIFSRSLFEELERLQGDAGARHVFARLEDTATVQIDPDVARDIDTVRDLANLPGLQLT